MWIPHRDGKRAYRSRKGSGRSKPLMGYGFEAQSRRAGGTEASAFCARSIWEAPSRRAELMDQFMGYLPHTFKIGARGGSGLLVAASAHGLVQIARDRLFNSIIQGVGHRS